MLLSVQAVGPKVALAVLSGGTPRELQAAIAGQDAARFQAVPGIGKRTAERIIVELREKVGGRRAERSDRRAQGGRADGVGPRRADRAGLHAREAEELLRGAEGDSAEDLIAQALRTARDTMSAETARIQTPYLVEEDELDRSLRPRRLRGLRRAKDAAGAARRCDRGGERARGGARPPAAGGATGPRQDLACADRRGGAGSAVRADRRPGARAQGRHRGVPDGPGAAERVLRGRDSPPVTDAGGDVLPGDGGSQAADHCRAGCGRARGDAGAAAVHARRRHHAHGPA